MAKLNAEQAKKLIEQNIVVIDIRSIEQVQQGFIKSSISLSSFNLFSHQAASLCTKEASLLFCAQLEQDVTPWVEQAKSMGLSVVGWFQDGTQAWAASGGWVDLVIDVEPDELMMDLPFDPNLVVMDLRSPSSFGQEHLNNAVNLPLPNITDPLRISAIEEQDNLYIIANNDEESYFAATLLKQHDIHNLRVVLGGWDAVKKQKNANIVKLSQ